MGDVLSNLALGFGGGVSKTESQTGMCLQAPSPLHSHSQVHAPKAGAEARASAARVAEAVLMASPLGGAPRHFSSDRDHAAKCAPRYGEGQ